MNQSGDSKISKFGSKQIANGAVLVALIFAVWTAFLMFGSIVGSGFSGYSDFGKVLAIYLALPLVMYDLFLRYVSRYSWVQILTLDLLASTFIVCLLLYAALRHSGLMS